MTVACRYAETVDFDADRRVLRAGVVDSTNERALCAVADGTARHGDWFLATGQQAGRGRRGAAWRSAEGEGFYGSLVLLPEPGGDLRPPALTMAAGLGVVGVARMLGLAEARLKWPNDLLLGPAKLAGILVEARTFDPARPHFVVGIGLNVGQQSFPPELLAERPVTSLALAGIETEVEDVFAILAPTVEKWIKLALDPAAPARAQLEAAYLRATGLDGLRVRVQAGQESVSGHLTGLALEGGLALRLENGSTRWVPLEHVAQVEPVKGPDGEHSTR